MTTILVPAWDGDALVPVEKLEVHRRGLRHKAVSVFVRDGAGRILLQQRADAKYHCGGLWANTCCTHPAWNESGIDCARRRLAEELGIAGLTLHPRPAIEYRARVGPDMVEHEVVEVFTAEAAADLALAPDPAEVQAVRWIDLPALHAELSAYPDRFTPWMRIYMADHAPAILGERVGDRLTG
ncbi:isopentenyl-diphosphate Delta-isomerase [Jannaschia sp. LMIT008]|uniref:isopentenyl-diphosphate Delta-isomerase n=1 Tax=Jannaschia maritima TaxID=3032585 RepID=UPI0028113810|nr:isopentenyl-diphosphate Delta-isomerase [Jannaschia sp. LMIT008]